MSRNNYCINVNLYHCLMVKFWFYWRSNKAPLFFILLFLCACAKDNVVKVEPEPIPTIEKRQKVIAILGSSTAEGVGASPRDSSWSNKLKYLFVLENRNINLINLARAGYTTFKILPSSFSTADTTRNVDKALSFKPDLIIINLPSNDFAEGHSDQQILDNYGIVTQKMVAANIPFIITTTQPRDFTHLEARKRLAIFNNKMEAFYADQMVYTYVQLATPDFYLNRHFGYGDGVHLNNNGHDVIFKSIVNDSTFKAALY